MRPRVFPAEDGQVVVVGRAADDASMRPRVFPAEDRVDARGGGAAGRASMRPRVFPAEDSQQQVVHGRDRRRFNEAAGIPRGRLSVASSALRELETLQ